MDPTAIKEWLEARKRSRAWLAEQCHVSKATVDGWLSARRPIPAPTQALIRKLMDEARPLNPQLDLETFLRAQRKAHEAGQTLEQWIEGIIKREAAKAD